MSHLSSLLFFFFFSPFFFFSCTRYDLAPKSEIPWYSALSPNVSVTGFLHTGAGRWITGRYIILDTRRNIPSACATHTQRTRNAHVTHTQRTRNAHARTYTPNNTHNTNNTCHSHARNFTPPTNTHPLHRLTHAYASSRAPTHACTQDGARTGVHEARPHRHHECARHAGARSHRPRGRRTRRDLLSHVLRVGPQAPH